MSRDVLIRWIDSPCMGWLGQSYIPSLNPLTSNIHTSPTPGLANVAVSTIASEHYCDSIVPHLEHPQKELFPVLPEHRTLGDYNHVACPCNAHGLHGSGQMIVSSHRGAWNPCRGRLYLHHDICGVKPVHHVMSLKARGMPLIEAQWLGEGCL